MAKPRFQLVKANAIEAEIRLIGSIDWWRNSGADFTRIVDELLDAGVTDLKGYINTCGGDVIEANEIYNQLKRFPGNKTAKIGAICASAGTIVALAFDQVEIAANGQYMIHEMMGSPTGTEKEIEAYLQLMRNLKEHYVDNLVKKTGLGKKEIENMIAATTWLSAKKAKEKKFVDAISDDEDPNTDIFDDVQNLGYSIPKAVVNQFRKKTDTNPNNSDPKMKQRIISALALGLEMKLNHDAADEALAAGVENMANELRAVKAELAKVNLSTAKAKAKILIDNAIAMKKITESEREQYENDAVANFEIVERILNKIPAVAQISAQLGTQGAEDRSKWTMKDWLEKDGEGLLKMRQENRTLYAKLYKDHYGRDCSF